MGVQLSSLAPTLLAFASLLNGRSAKCSTIKFKAEAQLFKTVGGNVTVYFNSI